MCLPCPFLPLLVCSCAFVAVNCGFGQKNSTYFVITNKKMARIVSLTVLKHFKWLCFHIKIDLNYDR